jgi:hypothetical protein
LQPSLTPTDTIVTVDGSVCGSGGAAVADAEAGPSGEWEGEKPAGALLAVAEADMGGAICDGAIDIVADAEAALCQ